MHEATDLALETFTGGGEEGKRLSERSSKRVLATTGWSGGLWRREKT